MTIDEAEKYFGYFGQFRHPSEICMQRTAARCRFLITDELFLACGGCLDRVLLEDY